MCDFQRILYERDIPRHDYATNVLLAHRARDVHTRTLTKRMAATDPLVPGARARALREYVSVPESTNIARLRAFAADMWIALVRRNEIASEKAMEKPGDCKFFSGNTTEVSLQESPESRCEDLRMR